MANSIQLDFRGPDWPLGFIANVTPGTPVNIMSVVDPSLVNDPSVPVPPATGTIPAKTEAYTVKAQQILFQAYKPGASHGTQVNTGNIYVVRKGVGAGTGNRDDTGSIVCTLTPGQTFTLASAPMSDIFSPYRYSIDADNTGDGAMVTLIIA